MPRSPYTDLDRPPLSAARLRRALVAPYGPWSRLELRTETGSTNADVAAAAQAGEPEGLVVVAERQTAGRGRRGRAWQSPPRAGIATSVLLRPGQAVPDRGWLPAASVRYGWLPLLAGVALVEAVTRLAELEAALKWPNDLLIGGSKCAGILAEAVPGPTPGDPPAVVLGIGLNVTLRADELPEYPTGLPATSLHLAGATATDRDPLLRALLRSLADWYARWRAAGGDATASGLRDAYLAVCATVGREVRALLPDGTTLTGTATTIDQDGHLLLTTPPPTPTSPPTTHSLSAADLLHLR
ncbi:biotin--[acetyl-CoA-carboxylase] ligase [Micromonospora qiuiae]|uniref:biotin--[biotin carboxyl-carrier protein] ligase n=1 Tax=Micromonospora qiuiae TaxID=502268 RepID=A0ABQ4J724_9ACTN|nr:biotin--[acetyl-CoA-carboxylase] ligase [Micromonospora qiuiae]GIJ25962.1 biotin--[acetyl-CoA-carboxylase] ligase [Micromonospora qiuiae]